MAVITEVGVASGVPNAGTGTAATLNGIFTNTAGPVVIATAAAVTAGSLLLPVTFPATGSTVSVGVTAATAAAVTAGTLMLPVTFPATGSVVTISTAQLGTLGQTAMASSASVAIASNQAFATAAIFPVGPIRVQKGVNITTIATTTETVIATAVSTTFLDLYGIFLANTSATATKVTINNATAGSVMATFQVPAGDTRGFVVDAGSAIAMLTAGNNITAVLGTSVSGVVVTALFVKN